MWLCNSNLYNIESCSDLIKKGYSERKIVIDV